MNSPRPHDADWKLSRVLGFLGLVAVIVVLGLLTKTYTGPYSEFVRNNVGGFFYVIFFVLICSVAFPKTGALGICIFVVAATCGVEFLQLYDQGMLSELRDSTIGKLLLGSTFSWNDFPPYFAGGLMGYFILNWFNQKKFGNTLSRS